MMFFCSVTLAHFSFRLCFIISSVSLALSCANVYVPFFMSLSFFNCNSLTYACEFAAMSSLLTAFISIAAEFVSVIGFFLLARFYSVII